MSERDRLFHPISGTLIAILVALAVAPSIHDFNVRETVNGRSERKADVGQSIAQAPPPSVLVAEPPQADDLAQRTERREIDDLKAQQQMAQLAFWMLIVTAIGVAYIARTLDETRNATEAAQHGVRVAIATNEAFADASKRELRPYVAFNGALFAQGVDPRNKRKVVEGSVRINWKNTGTTPATRLRCWLNIAPTLPDESPQDVNFVDIGNFRTEIAPLGPGQDFWSFSAAYPISIFDDCWQGKSNLMFWGWIEYTGLEPNVRHRTEVCAMLKLQDDPSKRPASSGIGSEYIYMTDFNAMDDDCVHKPKT